MRQTLWERFWNQVDQSEGPNACWPWLGWRRKKGYGEIGVGGAPSRKQLTHRVAYVLAVGLIPDGLFVCHHCDNPPCCNPRHLFVGTIQDNLADMRAKGRGYNGSHPGKRGTENTMTKLTPEEVRAIRIDGRKQREIAEAFDISQSSVSYIKNRTNWAHLD